MCHQFHNIQTYLRYIYCLNLNFSSGLSADILESGYVRSSNNASKEMDSDPVPPDDLVGDTVSKCNMEGDTTPTKFRIEVDQKGVVNTEFSASGLQNEDALESEPDDVELGDFFLDSTSDQVVHPAVLEAKKNEKIKELCSEKNLEKLEGIWKKVISSIHEADRSIS